MEQTELQTGTHTVNSHGKVVLRNHMYDWITLLLLVVIDIILYVIHPFYRFVGKDMMEDLKYPLKVNTVPTWSVPIYAVALPICIFAFFYNRRRDVYDLHNSILGLLYTILVTGVMTGTMKNAVGRPRPNFFWRCFPDGHEVYNKLGDVLCHGKVSVVNEGHKSFPSGHASISFAGLGFLSLYLSGKIKAFDRRGHIAKLCVVWLPLLAACLVGISRVDDYWHHWTDVFAGGLLDTCDLLALTLFVGLVIATFCYLQFFPPPYHTDGWGPYSYFRSREVSLSCSHPAQINNAAEVEATELQSINASDRGSNNSILQIPESHDDPSAILDELESGRR